MKYILLLMVSLLMLINVPFPIETSFKLSLRNAYLSSLYRIDQEILLKRDIFEDNFKTIFEVSLLEKCLYNDLDVKFTYYYNYQINEEYVNQVSVSLHYHNVFIDKEKNYFLNYENAKVR